MGLDLHISKIKRDVFYSISRDDFWLIALDNSIGKIYWRKRYPIHRWMHRNTTIIEQYSDELSKEKLIQLQDWLLSIKMVPSSHKVGKLIDETDFNTHVIYYHFAY